MLPNLSLSAYGFQFGMSGCPYRAILDSTTCSTQNDNPTVQPGSI